MLPDNFFADSAASLLTQVWDGFIAVLLSPLAALANIIYILLGGT